MTIDSVITPTDPPAVMPLSTAFGTAAAAETTVLPRRRTLSDILADALADQHTRHMAEADQQQQWAEQQRYEILSCAAATAERILGAEAAAVLAWTVSPDCDPASGTAEATAPMRLPTGQVQLRWRHTIDQDDAALLHLVWDCHSCGSRPEVPVTSLGELAELVSKIS